MHGLYEVSQQVGGFGRHIDGPIFVKFSKVKFGNKIQLFLGFYKRGFSFNPRKPALAMARAGWQTAIGDSTGTSAPVKTILFG